MAQQKYQTKHSEWHLPHNKLRPSTFPRPQSPGRLWWPSRRQWYRSWRSRLDRPGPSSETTASRNEKQKKTWVLPKTKRKPKKTVQTISDLMTYFSNISRPHQKKTKNFAKKTLFQYNEPYFSIEIYSYILLLPTHRTGVASNLQEAVQKLGDLQRAAAVGVDDLEEVGSVVGQVLGGRPGATRRRFGKKTKKQNILRDSKGKNMGEWRKTGKKQSLKVWTSRLAIFFPIF